MSPEKFCAQLRNTLMQIRPGLAAANLDSALKQIDRLGEMLSAMAAGEMTFSIEALVDAFHTLQISAYNAAGTLNAARGKKTGAKLNSAEKKALTSLESLGKNLADFQPVIKRYQKADKYLADYQTGVSTGARAAILQSEMNRITDAGMRPGYSDCDMMHLNSRSETQVFADFVWLGMQHENVRTSSGDYAVMPAGRYQKTYERLIRELQSASPAVRAKFACFMDQYERYLLSEANSALERISDGNPELTNGQRAEAITDPAIMTAVSFRSFRNTIAKLPLMSQYLNAAMSTQSRQKYAAVEDVVRKVSDPNLSDPVISHAVIERRAILQEGVKRVGFSASSREGQLFQLYEQLKSLEDNKSSPSYLAMAASLKRIIDRRRPYDENDPEFQKALRDCERAARNYVTTHRKSPYTSLGKKRVAAANSLLSLSRTLIEANVNQAEQANKQAEKQIVTQISTSKDSEKIDLMVKLSKLQKVITPVHTLSKVPQAVNTTSFFRKSGIGHQIANVTNVVFSNTIGLVAAGIAEAITHESDKGISEPLDTIHVPGSDKSQTYHDRVDENGLFTDTRKIPLVWAKEIPEEPVGDIEFSIQVEQAKDGTDLGTSKSSGFQDKDAAGTFDTHYGHAFITLKYTQKDPVTGQPKRYQTTFGFYPEEAFIGIAQNINQAQFGATSPGRITDDSGHAISASQTFKINAEQFNKIVSLTQTYEKDGYNTITRNCVSFVKDCVDEIGLEEAKELFKVTDLNSGAMLEKISSGAVTLGFGYSGKLAAKNELYAVQSMDSYRYQRFGQKIISKENLKQQDIQNYNMRAAGYSPGLLGEMIREKENVPIHTNKWKGTTQMKEKIWDKPLNPTDRSYNKLMQGADTQEEEKTRQHYYANDLYQKKYNLICLKKQFFALQNAIKSLPDFNPNDKTNAKALIQMKQFSDTLTEAMQMCIDEIDVNKDSKINPEHEWVKVDYHKRKQVFKDLIRVTNAYSEGMNDIFRNTFRSDPRLNLEFGKVISFAERIRDKATKEYPTFVRDEKIPFEDLSMLQGELDCSRVALKSLYNAKFRSKNFFYTSPAQENVNEVTYKESVLYSPLETVAAIKVYGSLTEAIKETNEKLETDETSLSGIQQKQRFQSISNKEELVKDLAKSMENRLTRNYVPTKADIKMFFYDLPNNEYLISKSSDSRNDSENTDLDQPKQFATNTMKGLVFEKYFSGFSGQFKGIFEQLEVPNNFRALTAAVTGDEDEFGGAEKIKPGHQKALNDNFKAYSPVMEEIKKTIAEKASKFISRKMRHPDDHTKKALKEMTLQTARHLYFKTNGKEYDPEKDHTPEEKQAFESMIPEAKKQLVEDITNSLLLPELQYALNVRFHEKKAAIEKNNEINPATKENQIKQAQRAYRHFVREFNREATYSKSIWKLAAKQFVDPQAPAYKSEKKMPVRNSSS